MGAPCDLHDLVRGVSQRQSIRPLLAVTFDDGYRDNLAVACPILERAGVPATVFVTPSAQNGAAEMWWDELTRLVLGPETAGLDLGWTISRTDDPTPGHASYRALFDEARRATPAGREAILAGLRVGDDVDAAPMHPLLDREEIARLDTNSAIEVGAHTLTHPVLSTLPVKPAVLRDLR